MVHRLLAALALFLILHSSARAALIASDFFEYDPGSALNGQSGGEGFGGAWTKPTSDPTQFTDNYKVAAGPLYYPGLLTPGNHISTRWVPGIAGLERALAAPVAANQDATRYISFLLRPDGVLGQGPYDGYFGVYLEQQSVFMGRPGSSPSAPYVLEKVGGAEQCLTGVMPVVGETILMVLKMSMTRSNTTYSLFIDPVPDEAEPNADAIKLSKSTYDLTALHLYSDGAFSLSNLRVGETFADVVPKSVDGDANGDGAVDLGDFGLLKLAFGDAANKLPSDFDRDGQVGLSDFGILKANFGRTTGNSVNVPEPATWLLAIVALAALVLCGRTSRKATRPRRGWPQVEALESRWTMDAESTGIHQVATFQDPAALPIFVWKDMAYVTGGGDTGFELFRTDGTVANYTMLKDIRPGPASSTPLYYTGADNYLFFAAETAAAGQELWRTDGTSAGTILLADVNPGSAGSQMQHLTAAGQRVFFTAFQQQHGYELWTSNGTPQGTHLVKDIYPGTSPSGPDALINVNGTLFFTAYEPAAGRELWKSDGAATGTVRVADIRPGSAGSNPDQLQVLGGNLLFLADDGQHGLELWRSDGTEQGTLLVKDIAPGGAGSAASQWALLDNVVYFSADDGQHGQELWRTDGTESGTWLVKDIQPGSGGATPEALTVVGNALCFTVVDGAGIPQLWATDGSPEGTQLLLALPSLIKPIPRPVELTNVAGTLFFGALDQAGRWSLGKSDGTPRGTRLVESITPVADVLSPPAEFTPILDTLLFTAVDQAHGRELWQSDGTAAGTFMVVDIKPGKQSSDPREFAVVNAIAMFNGDQGQNGRQWMNYGPFLPLIPGDVNADDKVDLTDFGLFKARFGSTAETQGGGDFDASGSVDLGDFGVFKANFGQHAEVALAVPVSAAQDFDAQSAAVALAIAALTANPLDNDAPEANFTEPRR